MGRVMKRSAFKEISNARLGPNRKAVISKLDDGSYTIGQQIEVNDNGKPLNVFLKGALHAANLEGLQNLRDGLNLAIKTEESKNI